MSATIAEGANHTVAMQYEIRIYKLVGKHRASSDKIRMSKIKSSQPIFGFIQWVKFWFEWKKLAKEHIS